MAKIHPHLKAFIHSVVVSEMGSVGPSKSYQWKETLMKQVQEKVLNRLNEIKSQADLGRITLEETKNVQDDFQRTMDMIANTLQQIPLEVLKQASGR